MSKRDDARPTTGARKLIGAAATAAVAGAMLIPTATALTANNDTNDVDPVADSGGYGILLLDTTSR